MSDVADLNESASDTGTETIKQYPPKPKRKCTPAQLEVLKRNREKALEVIRQKGEKARLQKELKDRYKIHVDTERDAEIERLKAALGESKPATKPAAHKRKRAPSPPSDSSESDESPPPPPKRKAKNDKRSLPPPHGGFKKRKPATPSETSSSEDCPSGNTARRANDSIDPGEARLQALHRQMFPFG